MKMNYNCGFRIELPPTLILGLEIFDIKGFSLIALWVWLKTQFFFYLYPTAKTSCNTKISIINSGSKHILILFSILIITKLSAQDNLDTLLKIAAQNNPALKARYFQYLSSIQKIYQVGSLPDLDASFGYFIQPMELVNGKQRAQIQLMQMFPWIGTLKAAKDEASQMALSDLELLNVQKEDIYFEVREKYYQLFLNHKEIEISDTNLLQLKSIEQLLITKSKTINVTGSSGSKSNPNQGNSRNDNSMNSDNNKEQNNSQMNNSQLMSSSNSVFSDLLLLKVEMKELENRIKLLQDTKQELTIQINLLLNRNVETEISMPNNLISPAFDFQNPALFDSIKQNNPMVKMNRADIAAYQSLQKMNRKMGYPMIGLGFNYSLIDKSSTAMSEPEMNGKDMLMPMIAIKIPIYRKKYHASVQSAKLMESSGDETLANTENMLYMQLIEFQNEIKDAERRLTLNNEVVDLIQKSFNILISEYANSGANFEELIRLNNKLLDYRLNYIQASVDKLTGIAGIQKLLAN
jgi:outer membrane protein TolC